MVRASAVVVVVSCTALCQSVDAQPAAFFSVANGGPGGRAGDDIGITTGGTLFTGIVLGLGAPGDDVNACSQRNNALEYLLCFSVDGTSQGSVSALNLAGPGPIADISRFNVMTQGAGADGRKQAQGSAFISTEAYQRDGQRLVDESLGEFNNMMLIHHTGGPPGVYDRGPNNFGLAPAHEPEDTLVADTNDVDCGSGPAPDGFFYSTTLTSPSTMVGASIVFDPDGGIGGNESLFASPADLGLIHDPGNASDDIDALVVFDDDMNGVFSSGDQVLFSLSRDSPSLALFGAGPADILSLEFGGVADVFIGASDVGLLSTDNMNMLALVPMRTNVLSTIDSRVPSPSASALLCIACIGSAVRRRRR